MNYERIPVLAETEYALYFPNSETVNVPYFSFRRDVQPDKNYSGGADPDMPAKACRQAGYGQFLDPVHGITGNIGWHKQDMFEGLPFDRFYNSLNSEGGGYLHGGWSHGYGQTIRFTVGVAALAIRPNGTPITFNYVNGNWVNTHGGAEWLHRNANGTWVLRLRSGDEETYASDGTLTGVHRASGLRLSMTHSATSVQVRDQFGKGFDIQLNLRGFINSITSPQDGQALANFSYSEYQGAQRLVSVQYVNSTVNDTETYLYENSEFPLQLTGIIDEKNTAEGSSVKRTAWNADASGYPAAVVHGGNVSGGSMSRDGHVVTVTDELGAQRTYTFTPIKGRTYMTSSSQPAGSGCEAASAYSEHDDLGNVIVMDDFRGMRACMVYSGQNAGMPANLETTRVEGLVGRQVGMTPTACAGVLSQGAALPPGARKITRQWHPHAAIKIQENLPLKRTIWVYNGQPDPLDGGQIANCVTPMYGASDSALPSGTALRVLCKQVEQATSDEDGSQGLAATTLPQPAIIHRHTYNQYGQMLSSTDPAGNTTTYHYHGTTSFMGSGFERVGHRMGDLWKTVNAKGQEVVREQYDSAGRLKKQRNPSGLIEVFAHSPRGWVLREKQCAAEPCDIQMAEGGRLTVYDYWPNGLLKHVQLPDGTAIAYAYDDAQRLTSITDAAGNSTTYVLDAKGNRIEEKVQGQGGVLARTVTRAYDALNRLQSVTGAAQ